MSNTPPDPPRPRWFSGLKGLFQSPRAPDPPRGPDPPPSADEVLPTWDTPPAAIPVEVPAEEAGEFPLATPVPVDEEPAPERIEPESAPVEEVAPETPTTITCPACTAVCPLTVDYCSDCGYYFSQTDRIAVLSGGTPVAATAPATEPEIPTRRLNDRYELRELISDRLGVQRFKAIDHAEGGRAVAILRQALPAIVQFEEEIPEATPFQEPGEELMPVLDDVSFGDPVPGAFPLTEILPGQANWPNIAWERKLLHTVASPSLPSELDHFADEEYEYLVEEVPTGQLLWDVWDDPDSGADRKFGYLADLAELMHRLHQCQAMVVGLRPDIVVLDNDVVRGTLYSAPELLNGQGIADARAALYSFGAMMYALNEHRELNERIDFDNPGDPKPFIPRYPDCHPALGRLMMKTFRKQVEARFPTDEAGKEDPTGFVELIRTLHVLKRTYDNVRLEIASWTSTGIVRTGNEDAFALMHSTESRQDDLGEAALIILCDGMGGYEAGEVAAALTIQSLRQNLSKMRPFSAATGESPFPADPLAHVSREEGHAAPPIDIDEVKKHIRNALREANKLVFQTSRAPGSKRRGMGCTAEVVYLDGRNVVVGHVGDSRTYHLQEGRLVQLTRDQTLVNRLVELGTLSAEEAETHPRRNELQQAIGGQPDVEPGMYHGKLGPGDWVVVCSDGLTNHVSAKDLQQMLGSEAWSAETAARRLVNLTLIEGATDNVTVVAVRAT
jgi:serine/threonine protein phosphatase PrpC